MRGTIILTRIIFKCNNKKPQMVIWDFCRCLPVGKPLRFYWFALRTIAFRGINPVVLSMRMTAFFMPCEEFSHFLRNLSDMSRLFRSVYDFSWADFFTHLYHPFFVRVFSSSRFLRISCQYSRFSKTSKSGAVWTATCSK